MRSMNTPRAIIPCLDVKDGRVVKGVQFVHLRDIGDPVEMARVYDREGADELVLLDISATQTGHDLMIDVIRSVEATINIPLTVGGGIQSTEDIGRVLGAGAAKVSLNSGALKKPDLIDRAAAEFGSERVCIAIDAVHDEDSGEWRCATHGGTKVSERKVLDWAVECETRGAGSLLVTSKDYDGMREGFDLVGLQAVCDQVSIPVIASGGAGDKIHYLELFKETDVSSGLAASIFHDGLVSIREIKNLCRQEGIQVYE